jgi:hypothetical protein
VASARGKCLGESRSQDAQSPSIWRMPCQGSITAKQGYPLGAAAPWRVRRPPWLGSLTGLLVDFARDLPHYSRGFLALMNSTCRMQRFQAVEATPVNCVATGGLVFREACKCECPPLWMRIRHFCGALQAIWAAVGPLPESML